MTSFVKALLKATTVYSGLLQLTGKREIRKWRRLGCPSPPPPAYKRKVIAQYAQRSKLKTFVETGTFFGDMVAASKELFQTLYSIELDETLYENARQRFNGSGNITILHGDSGKVLTELLTKLQGSCLFWLDGHYSGEGTARGENETPVARELDAICHHACREHVVLINDARLFDGRNGYPTIDGLKAYVLAQRPEWRFAIEHDIIRFTPNHSL